MDQIEQTTAEVTAALQTFARAKGDLYRPDGTPKYSEATQAERMITLTSRLHAVAERVDAAVEEEIGAVERLLEAEHDDPTRHLSPAELGTANGRALFVREDATGLPLPELLARLRAVAAKPSRADAFLWARYGSQRVAAEAEAARAAGTPLVGDRHAALVAIDAAVATLRAVVTPAAAIDQAEAARRTARAQEARRATHTRVREADGSNERMKEGMRARYSL